VLGHTRLKILDLTDRAAQPMEDEYGRWLVFNGEIYNFREIRKELELHGHRFRSTGDTEVLLRALSQWGTDAIAKLSGMFAFGWLDPKRRELILARDRFGVKPLVYDTTNDGVRFASDLFGLDEMAGGQRQIDPEAVRDYLMLGYVPAPRSIWRGPRKIMPGSYIRVQWREGSLPELSEHRYWSIGQVPAAGSDESDAIDTKFHDKIKAAVRSRLVSDVPVGLLLSGGIDSSVVAAACAELPANESNVPAFTMGFAEKNSDERIFARLVAQGVGLKHEEFVAEDTDIGGLFESMWSAYDEPFADSSSLPMLVLCREVAQRVTVAIGGDGGDEVWCGYPWHKALHRALQFAGVPHAARRAVARVAALGDQRRSYQGAIFAAADRIEAWSILRVGLTNESVKFLPISGEPALPRSCFDRSGAQLVDIAEPLDWASRMDLITYLPDDLMVKADRASMRVGLELREPMLDYELVEWGLTQPVAERFDLSERRGKRPGRSYLASRIPKEVLARPKQGFTPPLRTWLEGPLKEWQQRAVNELESGRLDPLGLPNNCKNWSDCAKALHDSHHQFLWRVICFCGWKAGRRSSIANPS
jgi:asparagine synthase (glutamine-hydrolysing)